ncbi:MAG: hypothetical protein A2W22_01365 [Candidatus Levybacteria bacterium RBG_16_35_11]|nr:MAG: hypothetical protein A2W22_01365 [Candidatus Levybacteria bacterium RBG_16_35_11]
MAHIQIKQPVIITVTLHRQLIMNVITAPVIVLRFPTIRVTLTRQPVITPAIFTTPAIQAQAIVL